MIITYFRSYVNEDTDIAFNLIFTDKLENVYFMCKRYLGQSYWIDMSIDKINYFGIVDENGKPILFNKRFEDVMKIFYSHFSYLSEKKINFFGNVNEFFKIISEDLCN